MTASAQPLEVVAMPDELGEPRFWTVAPFGAVGAACAALVTVDRPCEYSGLEVALPCVVGVV